MERGILKETLETTDVEHIIERISSESTAWEALEKYCRKVFRDKKRDTSKWTFKEVLTIMGIRIRRDEKEIPNSNASGCS